MSGLLSASTAATFGDSRGVVGLQLSTSVGEPQALSDSCWPQRRPVRANLVKSPFV